MLNNVHNRGQWFPFHQTQGALDVLMYQARESQVRVDGFDNFVVSLTLYTLTPGKSISRMIIQIFEEGPDRSAGSFRTLRL